MANLENYESKLRRFSISAPECGNVLFLRPVPTKKEPLWGILAPLRGTPWGNLISIVTGENMAMAIHGRVMPLMRELGKEPYICLKILKDPHRVCMDQPICSLYQEDKCQPIPKKIPGCYVAPVTIFDKTLDHDVGFLAGLVVLAWAEGRYVVLIDGEEFSY